MKDILINFTQLSNLLMLCKIIVVLASIRESAVYYRMIGIWRNSRDQEPANFRIFEES
jgi:hypothetical protein